MAVNTEGRREIVGLHIGPSEAEVFWSDFLKDLVRRGLTGVKLVISDAHEGLKGAITRVMGATWQRCRVHFMRNALSYVPKGQNTVVAAAIRQVFLQPDQKSATQVWRQVADQLRTRWPKLGACMDEAETDVLAYTGFPTQHRTKLHSTNPLERLNKEVKRRADVVGIFPNEDSIKRSYDRRGGGSLAHSPAGTQKPAEFVHGRAGLQKMSTPQRVPARNLARRVAAGIVKLALQDFRPRVDVSSDLLGQGAPLL